MSFPSLRAKLRAETADLHDRLDRAVGGMESSADYLRYLSGSYRFRASVEPAVRDRASDICWQPKLLSKLLATDLAAVGLPRPGHVPPLRLTDRSAMVGALYVLEGSAIGGAVIARRAACLGFTAGGGASHLAQQTEVPQRWKSFLGWLEQSGADDAAAIAAARRVFRTALVSFGLSPDGHPSTAGRVALSNLN